MSKSRRDFLIRATTGVAGVGAAGVAVPFVESLEPSAKARERGGPVEIDISRLKPGEMLVAEWRQQPLYVLRRSSDTVEALQQPSGELIDPNSTASEQPAYAINSHRSRDPEYLVLQGICTHLGCAPKAVHPADGDDRLRNGGFHCACHNSRFDLAGRALKGFPAGRNLPVPPHHFAEPGVLVVGLDEPV